MHSAQPMFEDFNLFSPLLASLQNYHVSCKIIDLSSVMSNLQNTSDSCEPL